MSSGPDHGGAGPLASGDAEVLTTELFEALLGHGPGDHLHGFAERLRAVGVRQFVRELVACDEFKGRSLAALAVDLPDLTRTMPERYSRAPNGALILDVGDAAGLRLIERLIREHRYYDSSVDWLPVIDLDKRVTAAVLRCLGATRVLELGCFAGSVLKLLHDAGVSVTGVEISHRALMVAHPSIYHDIRFGDLLDLDLPKGGFDAFLAMDILEHLSPLDLDAYCARIAELIGPQGFAYINSPMFGQDDVFGTVFPQHLPAWRDAGTDGWWPQMKCDARGWPEHGHLVWAAPSWWEALFARHGLRRDRAAERLIQDRLARFFAVRAPARKSLFILRPEAADPLDLAQVEAHMRDLLDPLLIDPTAP